MMSLIRPIFLLFCLIASTFAAPALAQSDPESLRPLVNELAKGKFAETEQQVGALAATGDPAAAPVLEALSSGDLYFRKSDGQVFIAEKDGKVFKLTDPLTQEAAGEAGRREVKKIKVNNKLRRVIRSALGSLTLMAPDPAVRQAAAEAIFKAKDPDSIEALDAALAAEEEDTVRRVMEQARAAAVLNSDLDEAQKLDAVATLSDMGNRDALSLLIATQSSSTGAVQVAAGEAVVKIEKSIAAWDAAQNIWYGLSLGSVLLLAAIGLAITFGVMGVINMAHGEMVMIGAYTTFVVQELIRTSAPGLFEYSLFIALPLAFLVSGSIGVAIERGVIRWLYGRPLETLLATWGISLILQQAVRSIFGPTNREVGNPDWMSGAFELGQMTITYNRMWIIVFAMLVFAGLILVLKKTPFGLYTRAVTQNRRMAASMGIRTPWVDALTFGLGSGIAGIAGVALSQIDNVLAQSRPGLHHRQLYGRGVWRCRQPLGHAGRHHDARRREQVPRALCRRRARQDLRARVHHSLYPEASEGPVRPQGPGSRSMMSSFLFRAMDARAGIFLAIMAAVIVLVPAGNLLVPDTSPFSRADLCGHAHGQIPDLRAAGARGRSRLGLLRYSFVGPRGVFRPRRLCDGHVSHAPDRHARGLWRPNPAGFHGLPELAGPALVLVRLRHVLVRGADGRPWCRVFLAFVFGWFAFRSRVTGVYLSIITQALTYALLLAFFRNDMGFGGNNGLTDFKDILGFDIQADTTRAGLFAASGPGAGPVFSSSAGRSTRFQTRQSPGRGARRRKSRTRFLRLPGGTLQAFLSGPCLR